MGSSLHTNTPTTWYEEGNPPISPLPLLPWKTRLWSLGALSAQGANSWWFSGQALRISQGHAHSAPCCFWGDVIEAAQQLQLYPAWIRTHRHAYCTGQTLLSRVWEAVFTGWATTVPSGMLELFLVVIWMMITWVFAPTESSNTCLWSLEFTKFYISFPLPSTGLCMRNEENTYIFGSVFWPCWGAFA